MRAILLFLILVLFGVPHHAMASGKVPAMIVVPFIVGPVTLATNSSASVNILIQNNTGTSLTLTNFVPQIPSGSLVTASITNFNCGKLAPKATCEINALLHGLTKPGNENLNISVCSFNGTLCSRITQPVSILNQTLTSISVSPTNPSISNGMTQQFYATGIYSDQSTQDITNSVQWSSSDPSKAVISNAAGSHGLATGVGAGASTIAATLDRVTGSTSLAVTSATLTSITVTPPSVSLSAGQTQAFKATGIYSDNSSEDLTDSVIWSSSDTGIATVSNSAGEAGVATGVAAGSALVTATSGAVSGSAAVAVTSATLESLSVTPANVSVPSGTLQEYTATGIFSDNTTADLTSSVQWNTGSALVAIVSNLPATKGLAIARAQGNTVITASLGSVTGSTPITVTSAVLKAINVSPINQTIGAGQTLQYTARGIYSNFMTADLTSTVTWTSSDASIATVSNAEPYEGIATGVAAGSVTISAEQQGVKGSTRLSVAAAVLTSLSLSPSSPVVASGIEQQFTATGNYSDGSTRNLTDSVTWISSSSSVAVISNADGSKGLASALAPGSTVISGIMSGVTGTTNLTVTNATLTSIAVTPVNSTLAKSSSASYVATGTYSDASTKVITDEVVWQSSNTSIATVSNAHNSKGLVTGISRGTITLKATLDGVVGTTSVHVAKVCIGDRFQGGLVACLEGGFNNLVTANTNNALSLAWGGSGTVTNAQSDVDGKQNTETIVSVLGAGSSYAAGLCDTYEIDSAGNTPCVSGNTCYNDWFLPSTNQISCIRSHRNQIDGFLKTNYWSSTETASDASLMAQYITFSNSGHPPASALKTSLFAVRCVRHINGYP